jgi:hypothetical protein
VYGANSKVPFSVEDNVAHPVSLYAATKKAKSAILNLLPLRSGDVLNTYADLSDRARHVGCRRRLKPA